jgi:hypothetical protein
MAKIVSDFFQGELILKKALRTRVAKCVSTSPIRGYSAKNKPPSDNAADRCAPDWPARSKRGQEYFSMAILRTAVAQITQDGIPDGCRKGII